MTVIDEIKDKITKLSEADLTKLRAWWDEIDAAAWDRQMEEDIKAGRFDKLAEAAIAEHKAGLSRKL